MEGNLFFSTLKIFLAKKTIQDISFIGFGTITTTIISLIFGVIAARYLGPDEFGRFGYYKSIFVTLGILFSLGLNTFVVIQISREPRSANKFITSNLINRTIAVIVFSLIFWFINIFFNFIPIETATIALFLTAIITNFESLSLAIYRAFQEMKYRSFFNIFRTASLLFIFVIFAYFLNLRIEGAALASLISVFLTTFLSYLIIINRFNFKPVSVNKSVLAELFFKGLPFLLSSIVTLLYLQIDTIMINRLIDDAETGYYVIATQILNAVLLIPGIFNTILLPKMSKTNFTSSRNKIWLKNLFLIGIVILFGLFFSASFIIDTLFGNRYSATVPMVQILSFLIPVSFVSASIASFLAAKKQQIKVLIVNATVLILNIPLNYLLIPSLGGQGAAYSSMLCSLITISLFLIFYNDYIKKVENNNIIN